MSRINTSTNIIDRNKEGTVSPIMTNSVENLTPAIQKLIKVITNSNKKIDGDCVMAVAFQQQGIHTFIDLQMFEFTTEFENFFSTYKANDADIETNSGPDVVIITGIKMYIRQLLVWSIYREDNKDKDINWNNWKVWTHEEFREFKLACRRGDIVPISSILPNTVCPSNGPRTTAAPINRDLDDWNRDIISSNDVVVDNDGTGVNT